MAGDQPLGRRGFGLGLLALAGCAGVRHGALPDPFGPPVAPENRLRVVIFELAQANIPFHAGLIIHARGEALIYDPAGTWQSPVGQCTRSGEVLSGVTPEVEEAYLNRLGVGYGQGDWITHSFDFDLPPEIAALALERVREVRWTPPLQCAAEVATLLHGLPGFEEIAPHWVTARLMEALLARPDVTYARRDLRDDRHAGPEAEGNG